MSTLDRVWMRTFGRPQGLWGRIGGAIMARSNRTIAAAVIERLELRGNENVLEVGFGPGVAIALLAGSLPEGRIAGIDPSRAMYAQARKRNAAAVASGCVDLRLGSVGQLPFGDDVFDAAMAINSMQLWPDTAAGLREIRRVLRPGGRIALGFTARSGQQQDGVVPVLSAAGFVRPGLLEVEGGFCALAFKP